MRVITKAVDFEAMVAANRELVSKLPQPAANTITWNSERLSFDVDTRGVTTWGTTSNGND